MIPEVKDLDKVVTFQRSFANKTLEWIGEDNQERFNTLLADVSQRRLLEKSGWILTTITYKFNSHGFRGHEFDPEGDYFCVFGDSVTFGAALNQEQTYGGWLEDRLGIKCYNFGQSGGSNDTCVRNAMTYLKDLKPRFVVLQTTFDHRFEWLTDGNIAQVYGVQSAGGGRPPIAQGDLFTNWIDVEVNRSLNFAKNIMCFRFICSELNLPLIEIDITEFFSPPEDRARDLLHPGPKIHRQTANRMMGRLSKLGLL